MRVVFLCPPVSKINGGLKYIFRMAEVLGSAGVEAVIFEKNQQRPTWFASTAPIIGADDLRPRNDEVLVLSEDQPDVMRTLASWPQRKVIYCQNHFYAALGAQGARSFADFGVADILCSSRTIMDYCQLRHPGTRAHLVPCAVDQTLFMPAVKTRTIALVPRKRPVEAMFIQDMFMALVPVWRDVEWLSLDQVAENEMAAALGRAAVFLALSRLDGFGLTPIEAMASGCVVAGFTGIGGREYATPQNGFWAEEDDFAACRTGLKQALQLWADGGQKLADYHAATRATTAAYTPEIFSEAVCTAWEKIFNPA
ncbi:MAG: glycosyltransferase [Alphaproteobacteria bacterium]